MPSLARLSTREPERRTEWIRQLANFLAALRESSHCIRTFRLALYTVNAKVRLMPLVWIGRDNIGGARITRRHDASGRRTFELLVGSDPDRAPRRINRWGFIRESLNEDGGETLGAELLAFHRHVGRHPGASGACHIPAEFLMDVELVLDRSLTHLP